MLSKKVNKLISTQLNDWEQAKNNYDGLKKVITKTLGLSGKSVVKIQFNPERIRSSAAKVDKKSIDERPCFLCAKNRPKEQQGIDFDDFTILINPFPIFNRHLTIVHHEHRNQEIKPFFEEMLKLSKVLSDFTVFYNGPKCGASAPDHFHFQAGNKNFLPIEKDFISGNFINLVTENTDYQVYKWENYGREIITLVGTEPSSLCKIFNQIYNTLTKIFGQVPDPMLNILSSFDSGKYTVHLFPRVLHRPDCFFKTGDEQILLSPASVDMGGVLITPRKEDFKKITAEDIDLIFRQVSVKHEDIVKILHEIL